MSVQQDVKCGVFENNSTHFQKFSGTLLSSLNIKSHDFSGCHVSIIGLNQSVVTSLDDILQQATSVKIFQIEPQFILPSTERSLQRLMSHPLIRKNKRLFSSRIKRILSLRFLESQVEDPWLRRELMPNIALTQPIYLKSDRFYSALQRPNCELITWPVMKITSNSIYCLQGDIHPTDVIIYTY